MTVLGVGVGLLCIAFVVLGGARSFNSIILAFGTFLIAMGVLFAMERTFSSRKLVLDETGLSLPTGFFRRQTTFIPYAEMRRVRPFPLPLPSFARVITNEETHFIQSAMLLDADTCAEIEGILVALVAKRRSTSMANSTGQAEVMRLGPPVMTFDEFRAKKAESEHLIKRRVIPMGLVYSVQFASGICVVILAVLTTIYFATDARTGLLYLLCFCLFLLVASSAAERDSRKHFDRLSFKCPSCQYALVFIDEEEEIMETGRCFRCEEPVFSPSTH